MVTAARGITAGSGLATDELHIIMYLIVKEAYLVDICPTIAVYVDDTSVYLADPSPTKAATKVARIIDFIVDRLERQEGLQVSGPVAGQSKSVVVGSSPKVAHMLTRASTTQKLMIKRATKNLGAVAAGG